MQKPKISRNETPSEAASFTTRNNRYRTLGLCPRCASQAAYGCEHRDCATIWGLTLAYDRPCGCPRVDVSAPGGGVHQAAGRVGSDLIGA